MTATPPGSDFRIGPDDFLLDGRPHRVLSGSLHYFRVHPAQWRDRIRSARLLGLNTIETYVPWNLHSPREGEFRADGGLDLAAFLDDVAAEGMHAIVRPGPYICAEWDNGGLPVWLTRSGVRLRIDDPGYLAAVATYLEHVYEIVVPRQVDRGGPVLLVQIENEYGAYETGPGTDDGSDGNIDDGIARRRYLERLVEVTRNSGIVVPLTTVDQPTDEMLSAGTLPGLLTTGSFGGRAAQRLETLRRHQPEGPLMCSEFWVGWFDHWGAHHHTTSAADSARELEELLSRGASVNIYMVHGGTNFGFTSGANDKGVYQPTITSYDYDALLDEAGAPTEKFWAFREVLGRWTDVPAEEPRTVGPAPVLNAPLTQARPLLELLDPGEAVEGFRPLDELERADGTPVVLAVLGARSPGSQTPTVLSVGEVRDRVVVRLDGVRVGVLQRDHHDAVLPLPAHPAGARLELLVEDMGRVNYGPRLGEAKGVLGPVRVGGVDVLDPTSLGVDDTTLVARFQAALDGSDEPVEPLVGLAGPVLARGFLDVTESADLFLDTAHWGKGVVWVNGFCLGRYWRRGPQRTLYVPAPVVVAGRNEVVVLELDGSADLAIRTLPGLDLGHEDF